jgi:hypothetical protein
LKHIACFGWVVRLSMSFDNEHGDGVQKVWVIGNWEEIVVYYKCVTFTFEMNINF